MPAWDVANLGLRYESLFGDRVVWCCKNRPHSLPQMLGEAVARAAAQEALIDGELRLTWQALEGMVREVAAGLAQRGVSQGDRVAVLLGNRAEFVVLLHAVARLGAVFVPIGAREQGAGIDHIVRHSGARILIYDAALAERLPLRTQLPDVAQWLPVPARGAWRSSSGFARDGCPTQRDDRRRRCYRHSLYVGNDRATQRSGRRSCESHSRCAYL